MDYILLAKGPQILHYVDKDNQFEKVEASHPNALPVEVHGGKLKIQRDNQDPIWVTWGHVQVVEAAGEAAGAAGRRVRNPEEQEECATEERAADERAADARDAGLRAAAQCVRAHTHLISH